jgi:predicted TIM-barrel enzyme
MWYKSKILLCGRIFNFLILQVLAFPRVKIDGHFSGPVFIGINIIDPYFTKKKKLTGIGFFGFPPIRVPIVIGINGFGLGLMFVEHQSTSGTKIHLMPMLHNSSTA